MKSSRLLLVAASALLLTAVGLVVYGSTQIPAPRFTGQLSELLPPAPAGWTKKEKPIADSPEMQEAVGEILNFDDGVFVDYTSTAGERLSVYIAYWTPGKMSHRLVAVHTPDVCWVGGGWKKTESSRLESFTLPQVSSASSPQVSPSPFLQIPPGEDRVFTAQGTPEYVWFWHIVGNESKSYGTGGAPPWYSALTDLFAKGVNQREEQFFIRVSSNTALQPFMSGPTLPAILTSLPWPPTGQP
ncbi:MAG: exosortase-associated EpsI family protein [Burkholderiales bacterium]|nr:exosortase-associated EpsI family protein [Opitutaceae bacterium]